MEAKIFNFLFCLILVLPLGRSQDKSFSTKEKALAQAEIYYELSEEFSEFNYDSCLYFTQLALEQYEVAEDWQGYTNMLSGMAGVNYYLDNIEQALYYNQLAIESTEKHLGKTSQSLGHALNTKGLLQELKGQYLPAIENWKKALDLIKINNGEEQYIAGSLLNIAHGYKQNGDYGEAIAYLKQASQYYKKTQSHFLVQVYSGIAKNYQSQKEYAKAIFYNRKAEQVFQKTSPNVRTIDQQLDILLSQNEIYHAKNQLDSALYFLNIAQQKCPGDDFNQLARIHREYGSLYLQKGQYDLALDYFQKSQQNIQDRYGTQERHPRMAASLQNIAKVYQAQGKHQEAIKTYQQALIKLSATFASTDFSKNPEIDNLLSLREGFSLFREKGKVLLATYAHDPQVKYLEAAHHSYLSLAQLLTKIRQSYESEESQRFLLSNAQEVYEEAIAIALQLYEQNKEQSYLEKAFAFAESNKSILLQDALRHNQAFGLGGLPDSLLEKEADLRISIAFYERNILEANNKKEEGSEKQIQTWDKQVLNIRLEYQRLVAHIEKEYPHFYQLKYRQDQSDITAIQKKLAEDSAVLLEYFLGTQQIYLFAISKDEIEVLSLPNRKEVLQQIVQLRKIITQRPLSENFKTEMDQFCQSSYSLHQQLIPSLAMLQNHPQKLIIIPDGELNYLPFEILLMEEMPSPVKSYRPIFEKALFHQHLVSYSYSASLLLSAPAKQDQQEKRFLGFAPSFGKDIASTRSCNPDNLYSLECNQSEVENIQHLFPGESFYGFNATRKNLRSQLQEASIIHLATHACVDEDQGNFNRIFLADGDLSNFEIKNLPLQADLITLSACNTGFGKLLKGEGLMSLAKSFAIAGCPSTLMSIWSVDDCATSEIMLAFYQQLRAGKDKDEALHFAKKQYLGQADKLHAHPYYWAAFIQMGNTQALYASQWPWTWWLGAAFLLLFLVAMFYSRKRKPNHH